MLVDNASEKMDEEKNIKNVLEILLFLNAEEMSISDIMKKIKAKKEVIEDALNKLIEQYEKSDTCLTIMKRGDSYIMTIKPQYLDIAKGLSKARDLTKKELALLAIIEKNEGIKKSVLAKKLGNHIYISLKELVKKGFLIEEKGKKETKLWTTRKYKDYVNMTADKNMTSNLKT